MAQIQITFPDGSTKPFDAGVTGLEIAKSISPGLAKVAMAIEVDGQVCDLGHALTKDATLRILTFDDAEGREVFWHSSAHVMAQAVQELFPGTKLAIGPPIDEGWYYDFDVEKPFSPEDLQKVEKRMKEIVAEKATFSCREMSSEEALKLYREQGETYKVELIEDLGAETVSFYAHSSFEDLCRGPHVPSTGVIKAFKLISSSGAYWRGDEKRPMLQRIYGVAYPKKNLLDDYLTRLEEAKKRDHRVIGKQMELFHFAEEVGAGLVLWMPRGARIRQVIEDYWRQEHVANDYDIVFTPHIAKQDLWNQSGHTGFYAENMYKPIDIDGREFQLKPMNCPFHIQMYKSRLWSYRDLPLRWAELGSVYRYERPGVLHGLLRVRGFTMDDAHHFVARDKIEEELAWTLGFSVDMLKAFGFTDYAIKLSTRPEKAIGDPADWDKAEKGLAKALEAKGLDYEVDEGEGAFYGPKIDIKIKDAIGRQWQCSTVQFDFSLPERFDLYYTDRGGERLRPFMVHRALLGSIERFFGVLIEHYAGNFPLWLAPVQVAVLPISDDQNDYCAKVVSRLKEAGFRVELNDRSEKIGGKIRAAEVMKTSYMFVVGAREAETDSVSVRKHGTGDIGVKTVDEAVASLLAEVVSKGLE